MMATGRSSNTFSIKYHQLVKFWISQSFVISKWLLFESPEDFEITRVDFIWYPWLQAVALCRGHVISKGESEKGLSLYKKRSS